MSKIFIADREKSHVEAYPEPSCSIRDETSWMMILFLKRSKNTASDGQEEPRLWLDTCMHKGIVELTKLQGTVAQCAGILPPRAGSKRHALLR